VLLIIIIIYIIIIIIIIFIPRTRKSKANYILDFFNPLKYMDFFCY